MLRDDLEKIMVEYASIQDDDSDYFVEDEVKKKYIDQLESLFNSNLKEQREKEINKALKHITKTMVEVEAKTRKEILRECIEEFNHPEWCYDKAKQFKECPRCILEAKLATNTFKK